MTQSLYLDILIVRLNMTTPLVFQCRNCMMHVHISRILVPAGLYSDGCLTVQPMYYISCKTCGTQKHIKDVNVIFKVLQCVDRIKYTGCSTMKPEIHDNKNMIIAPEQYRIWRSQLKYVQDGIISDSTGIIVLRIIMF